MGTDFTETVQRAVLALTFERAGKGAVLTLERFLAAVNAHVTREVRLDPEGRLADVADVRRVSRVFAQVQAQVLLRPRAVVANLTTADKHTTFAGDVNKQVKSDSM